MLGLTLALERSSHGCELSRSEQDDGLQLPRQLVGREVALEDAVLRTVERGRRQAPYQADEPARAPAPPRSGRRRRRCPVGVGSGSRSRSRCRGSAPAAGSRPTLDRLTLALVERLPRGRVVLGRPASVVLLHPRVLPPVASSLLRKRLSPDIAGAACRRGAERRHAGRRSRVGRGARDH
jgi:hypothetical protein